MQINMLEAKSQLSKLVQAAQKGEEVVIAKNGVPVARLLAFRQPDGLKGWGRLKASVGNLDAAFSPDTDAEIARLMTGGA